MAKTHTRTQLGRDDYDGKMREGDLPIPLLSKDQLFHRNMNPLNSAIQTQLTAWLLRRTAVAGAFLSAAIATDVGSVRGDNQDRGVIARGRDSLGHEYAVAAVADGIGGMRDGAACAAISLGTFLDNLRQHAESGTVNAEDWIRRAANAANQAVFTKYRGDGGSTLVAVLVRSGFPACWLSVGDSRVYISSEKFLNKFRWMIPSPVNSERHLM
ncbi:MAG: protein phosphatase 2C domain-containing protein [Gammaproteobacteria bacterium]|nr:protein phosphatase 2C domain-containing protein [Gammaproteobacteria bacterium]